MSKHFIKAGALFLVAGILLGILMHHQHSRALVALHAHVTLGGGVLMLVFGLVYRLDEAADRSKLAAWHFWLYLGSSGSLLAWAAYEALNGRSFDDSGAHRASAAVSVVGLAFAASLVLFLVNVFRNGFARE